MPEKIQNTLQVEDVQIWGTSLYRVAVGNRLQGTNDKTMVLVALGQGYDEGWVAFEVKA